MMMLTTTMIMIDDDDDGDDNGGAHTAHNDSLLRLGPGKESEPNCMLFGSHDFRALSQLRSSGQQSRWDNANRRSCPGIAV